MGHNTCASDFIDKAILKNIDIEIDSDFKAAEDGFESDEEFVAVLGSIVDDPVQSKEKADEAEKGDDKD